MKQPTGPMFLRTFLARLASDTAGVSVVETAFIVPTLVALTCGTADAGFGFTKRLKVQQAAARSIELATASGLITNLPTALQAEGAAAAGVPASQVTVDMWLECGGVRQTDFNGICTASSPSRFASITIRDTYKSMFSPIVANGSLRMNGKLTVPLRGFAVVRIQ